jgi:O-antigen/teichoic acid export membrane protein
MDKRTRRGSRARGHGDGRVSRAVGNAATYALANALPRLLTFVLLPLYTRALTPVEYGRLSLILVIGVAASFLLASGLDVAVLRIYFQLPGADARKRFVDSLWLAAAATSVIGTAIALVAASPFISTAGTVRSEDLIFGLAGAAVLVAGTTIPQSILRAQQRRKPYLLLSLANASLSTGVTLLLVVGLGLGPRGWLIAILIANAGTLAIAVLLVGWRPPRPFDGHSVRRAFGLGIPLIPHALAQWSLLLADRGVLAAIVSTAQLGIYSLAATMTTPALVVVQSISQGFATSYAAAGSPSGDKRDIRRTVSLHSIFVLWVCLAVVLLAPCAIGLLTAPAFRDAAPLVPWLAVGYLFLGLYYVPMSGLSLGAGKTRLVWVFSVGAAIINLALVRLLVPHYGLVSAAIASAVGYLALLVSVFAYSTVSRAPVEYDWRRLASAAGSAVAVSVAALMTTNYTTIGGAAARVGWTIIGVLLIGMTGGLRPGRSSARTARLHSTLGRLAAVRLAETSRTSRRNGRPITVADSAQVLRSPQEAPIPATSTEDVPDKDEGAATHTKLATTPLHPAASARLADHADR